MISLGGPNAPGHGQQPPGQLAGLRGITLALAALLAGCSAGGLELDRSASADMQRCGVDIQMSNSFRIALMSDARDRKLSAANIRQLRSTIFEQVPETSRLAVYKAYVDCITSRRALDSALTEIATRKAALTLLLRDRYHVPQADIRKIEAYYDEESDELRTGRIVAARATRAAMIYELAGVAARGKFTLDRQAIISTGGRLEGDDREDPAAKAEDAEQKARFLAACRAAADETLCRSMEPVYDRIGATTPGQY